MTFNVHLFLSVLFGFSLGYFLFKAPSREGVYDEDCECGPGVTSESELKVSGRVSKVSKVSKSELESFKKHEDLNDPCC